MLVNKNGKIAVVTEDEYCLDDEMIKKNDYNFIKNLSFDKQTFVWYLLTRKDTKDFKLYQNIIAKKDIKNTYKQIMKNIRKQGNWKMNFQDLLELYISKRFNEKVLKPMCKNALNKNWKRVKELSLIR